MIQQQQQSGATCLIWLALLLSVSLGAGAARAADEVEVPAWAFSGFGSLGAVHSNQREADFTSNVVKGAGVGYSRSWSADIDSRLGAQLDWRINPQWSAVVQVISEQNRLNSYAPAVEWGNVKYQITPDFSVRAGRVALPVFLYADYRKVGYALPWVRPPVELYGTFGVSSSDGADLSYSWRAGGLKNVTQAFYGGTTVKITDTSTVPVRGLMVLTHTIDYGALTLRASFLSTRLSIDLFEPLFDGFRQYGAQGNAIADKYAYHDKHSTTASAAVSYDPGAWFAMSELGHISTHSFIGEKSFIYASAGVRLATLTPYLSYSSLRVDSETSDPGLNTTGMPPRQAAGAMALNAGLNKLLRATPQQKTFTAGVRWDVWRNTALKAQYDRVVPQAGSAGTLVTVQSGFQSGRALDVLSVVLDFVY